DMVVLRFEGPLDLWRRRAGVAIGRRALGVATVGGPAHGWLRVDRNSNRKKDQHADSNMCSNADHRVPFKTAKIRGRSKDKAISPMPWLASQVWSIRQMIQLRRQPALLRPVRPFLSAQAAGLGNRRPFNGSSLKGSFNIRLHHVRTALSGPMRHGGTSFPRPA